MSPSRGLIAPPIAKGRRPVIGKFANGTGTFLAEDELERRPIRLRFLWLATDTKTPRWEQAMSDDEGARWETNWTMDFSRG